MNIARSGDHIDALSQPNHLCFPSGHHSLVYKSQLRLVDTFKGVRSNSPRLHHELLASLGLTSSAPQSHCILPVHSDAVAQAMAEREEVTEEGLAPSPG